MCLWLPCECQDFNFFLDFTFSAIIVKLAQSNFLTSEVLCLGNCFSFIRNPSSVTSGGSLQLQRRQSGAWSFVVPAGCAGGAEGARGSGGPVALLRSPVRAAQGSVRFGAERRRVSCAALLRSAAGSSWCSQEGRVALGRLHTVSWSPDPMKLVRILWIWESLTFRTVLISV